MDLPYHGKYEWLPMLYNIVKHFKPNKIVEFGPGRGQTTVTMALALKELGKGKINSYDLWNDDKLLDLYENVKQDIVNGSVVLFEGGSLERDNHGVGGRKMNDVKNEIGYEVLTDDIKYSFSIIYNKNLYNLGS